MCPVDVMNEPSFEERVILLHGEAKWREIVSLGALEENDQGRRLLWVWPRLNDLDWLKKMFGKYELDGIASIGCGSGLFEWIIQQHSGNRSRDHVESFNDFLDSLIIFALPSQALA